MRNLSNYEIVKIAEGMPGGVQGFCKTWGWVQFGRALLTAAAATPPDQDRPDAIAKWGTPPAAEGGIKWQCGPQACGFTAPQTESQPVPVPRWDEMIRQQFPDMPPKGWSDTLIRRYMTRELDAYRAARAALVSQQPAPSVAAHKACKPDMLVSAGALKLALNVLRRAGKHEVADELEKTAQAAPAYKDSTPELHVGDSAFESWYSTYNPAHKSDKQRASDAFAAGVEWEANRRQAETPFAWAEFDGEGGYYLCLYEDNEGYRDEFLKRNPNPIYKTWVFPLVKQK